MTTPTVRCPDCGGLMVLRGGKYGDFFGCQSFPACRGCHAARDGKPVGVPADAKTRLQRRKVLALVAGIEVVWEGLGRLGARKMLELLSGVEAGLPSMTQQQCEQVLWRWSAADRAQVEDAFNAASEYEASVAEASSWTGLVDLEEWWH